MTMEWQPIETAPMDGSWILLCGGKTDEDDYNKEGVAVTRPVVAMWLKYNDSDGEWVMCYWDGGWRTGYENPTHWLPIMQAPK